jgi:hypothetical protein
MISSNCPSCGAAIRFLSKVSLYAVCPSCSSFVMRHDMDLERIGVIGELQDDGTPLQLGSRGRFRGRAFDVVGRIQLQFPAGYWNEWYLSFPGDKDGWLGETQGLYGVNFRTTILNPVPAFGQLRVGMKVQLNQELFEVKDIESATCIGGEGELPFHIESDYIAPVVDLGSPTTRFATIDYSEDPPLVFLGDWCEFAELELSNLRQVEGW